MHTLLRIAGVVLAALLACGCQTTRPEAPPADYREDQATRQTQRDSRPDNNEVRRPMQPPRRDGQSIIDQPR
jgi:hypothetical protein